MVGATPRSERGVVPMLRGVVMAPRWPTHCSVISSFSSSFFFFNDDSTT